MIFKDKLSPQLSKAIKANTTQVQRESVAAIHEISIHTLNSVINRQRNVSDGTRNAVIDIMEVAIESANLRSESLTACLSYFTMDTETDKVKALVLKFGEIEDIGWDKGEFICLIPDRNTDLPDHCVPYYIVSIGKNELYDFIVLEDLNIFTSECVDEAGNHTTSTWAMDVEEVPITQDIMRAFIMNAAKLKTELREPLTINN
jgi:hypothetical protein